MTARFALAACRGASERQAINAMDGRREEIERKMGRTLGSEAVSAMRARSEEAFLASPIQPCAGAGGLERLGRAEQGLAAAAARAGVH